MSKVYPIKLTELTKKKKKSIQVKLRLPSYFSSAWSTLEEGSAVLYSHQQKKG